jgi:hypothetical protein
MKLPALNTIAREIEQVRDTRHTPYCADAFIDREAKPREVARDLLTEIENQIAEGE